jgi:hypothetical protein
MVTRIALRMFLASALALVFCSLSSAQTYPVRLERPCKKGERYRISGSASSSQKRTLTAEGKVLTETQGFNAEFGADGTAVELASDGKLIKEALTINYLRVHKDGNTRQPFPKGTVVVAAVENGHRVFRVAGQPVDKQFEELLDMLTEVSSSQGGPSEDEIFGTAEPRKVGDSWSVNTAAAIKSLYEDTKIVASQEDTHGVVTIEKKTACGNEDCLLISGRLDSDLITIEMDELKVDSGESHLRFSETYPVDTAHRSVDRTYEMQMRVSGKVKLDPKGPELQVEMKHESKMAAHYSPL